MLKQSGSDTRVHIVGVSFTTCIKILSWILNSHFFTHDISCCSWSKNHLTIRPCNYRGICFARSTNRMQIPLYLYGLAGDFYWHDHVTSCHDVTTADIMSKKMWIEDSRKNFCTSNKRYTNNMDSNLTIDFFWNFRISDVISKQKEIVFFWNEKLVSCILDGI